MDYMLGTWTILTTCVWNSKEEASPLDFLLQFTSVKLNADAAGQAVEVRVQLCVYRGERCYFGSCKGNLLKIGSSP